MSWGWHSQSQRAMAWCGIAWLSENRLYVEGMARHSTSGSDYIGLHRLDIAWCGMFVLCAIKRLELVVK